MKNVNLASSKGTFEDFKRDVLNDFYVASLSRQVSILGRKEVLSGKGKFGIFGDGKELAQIAMAKVFQNGDFRSGYYRDQTFMMAIGALKPKHVFASVYGHALHLTSRTIGHPIYRSRIVFRNDTARISF